MEVAIAILNTVLIMVVCWINVKHSDLVCKRFELANQRISFLEKLLLEKKS